jgi:hypothetical protein
VILISSIAKGPVACFWELLCKAVGSCVLLFVFMGCVRAESTIPVSVPIKFGIEIFAEFPVIITKYRNYYLDLVVFFENSQERQLARQIVGDATNLCGAVKECGEASTFDVTVRRGNETILQRRAQPYGHYAFSERAYFRNILVTPLRPGTYDIRIEIAESGLGMRNVKTAIQLTTDPRERDLGASRRSTYGPRVGSASGESNHTSPRSKGS